MHKFLVQNKKYRFEFCGSLEDLMNELEGDEIPCTVTNLATRQKLRISKKMAISIKENSRTHEKETSIRSLGGLTTSYIV